MGFCSLCFTSLQGLQEYNCQVQEPTLRSFLQSGPPIAPPAAPHAQYPPQTSLRMRSEKKCFNAAYNTVSILEVWCSYNRFKDSPRLLIIFFICSSRYSRRLMRASDQRSLTQLRSSSWKHRRQNLCQWSVSRAMSGCKVLQETNNHSLTHWLVKNLNRG